MPLFLQFLCGSAIKWGQLKAQLKFSGSAKKFCGRDFENMRIESKTKEIDLPEMPTNCCMSGCANCVWIQYAEELAKKFRDGGAKSREIIMNKVEDPNMKAFLSLELKSLKKE